MNLYLATIAISLASIGVSRTACAADEMIGNAASGRGFAAANCTECHATEPKPARSISPAGAPSFLAVANAKTTTALGLNVFLVTPHSTMPNIMISEQDRQNVVAYIMSMRRR